MLHISRLKVVLKESSDILTTIFATLVVPSSPIPSNSIKKFHQEEEEEEENGIECLSFYNVLFWTGHYCMMNCLAQIEPL